MRLNHYILMSLQFMGCAAAKLPIDSMAFARENSTVRLKATSDEALSAANEALAVMGIAVATTNGDSGRIISRVMPLQTQVVGRAVGNTYSGVAVSTGVLTEVHARQIDGGYVDLTFIDRAIANGNPDAFGDNPSTRDWLSQRAQRFFTEMQASLGARKPRL